MVPERFHRVIALFAGCCSLLCLLKPPPPSILFSALPFEAPPPPQFVISFTCQSFKLGVNSPSSIISEGATLSELDNKKLDSTQIVE